MKIGVSKTARWRWNVPAEQRCIFTVCAWQETPYFTEAERAVLALTEEVTRLSDRPDAVPDETWYAAAHHYDQQARAALIIQIALINVWNRFNATVRQVAGEWKP